MLHFFARKLREMQEVRRDERGFTLIELLVVVIIIGILAGIAIPVFLNQRQKAQEATVQSDLRNAASAQSAFSAENNGAFATTQVQLEAQGFRKSAGVSALAFDAAPDPATEGGYCMSAQYTGVAGTTYHVSEKSGGVQAGGC